MGIDADVVEALDGISVGSKVYPQAAPEKVGMPYVIYRKIGNSPLRTLLGATGDRKTTFVFECWAEKHSDALELAQEVRDAIEAATNMEHWFEEDGDPDDYELTIDSYMEPVLFSFWRHN